MREYNLVIYGAYGYTGKLITTACRSKALTVLLSGRNSSKLEALSQSSGYPYEACDIDDISALMLLLKRGELVIHCAGPFKSTAVQMVEACLEAGTHYLDITGEHQVFEMLAAYDERAREKGIVVMPGVGFDVVPSDCLAVRLKNRLPGATHLELAFTMSNGGVSRGTARTMIEGLGYGSMIRKDGRLVAIPFGKKVREVDFGTFTRTTMCIPWGDISTAWRSTGIRNIEVYTGIPKSMIRLARLSNNFGWLLRNRWIKNILRAKVDRRPSGPDEKKLNTGRSFLWGRAFDSRGNVVEARLKTVNGYLLTSRTAALIAEKILSATARPGYYTPAQYFGERLILEVEGSEFSDQ